MWINGKKEVQTSCRVSRRGGRALSRRRKRGLLLIWQCLLPTWLSEDVIQCNQQKMSVCPEISDFQDIQDVIFSNLAPSKRRIVTVSANNNNNCWLSKNVQISKMSKGIRCVGLGISSAASASELESTFAQPLTFLPTHQLTTIVFVIKHKTNIKHKRSADL